MKINVVDIDENDKINKSILEKHITKYMSTVGKVLAITFFVILFIDVVMALLIKANHFKLLLLNKKGVMVSYSRFLFNQITYQLSIGIIFGIIYLLWKKAGFSQRKTLICALGLITTSIFCFFHWKNNCLSILYVIPIVIAIPFDKNRNKAVIYISILMIIIYSVYQFDITRNESSYLIAASSIITVIALQFICIKIHNAMNRAFLDIKAYATQQEVLFEKISHDELTGAFSKTALESDILKIDEYNSLSFIDIDNFKNINDSNGHQMGDNILKLLVFCLKSKDKNVYRYGGDEFIILSQLTVPDLAKDLTRLKTKFSYYAQDLFTIKATISVGIINIDHSQTGSENIKRCDRLMYKSKDKGKDTLTVEE